MIQTQFYNVYKETIELIINDTLEQLIESIKFFEDRTGIEKGSKKPFLFDYEWEHYKQ